MGSDKVPEGKWDQKYCCDHFWKIRSALVSVKVVGPLIDDAMER